MSSMKQNELLEKEEILTKSNLSQQAIDAGKERILSSQLQYMDKVDGVRYVIVGRDPRHVPTAADNIAHLKKAIKALMSLRDSEILTDEDFTELLVVTCNRFVEEEVEVKVNQTLQKVLKSDSAFGVLMEFCS